jgi:hypothetical protein
MLPRISGGTNDSLGAFVCQMTVDHQDCMNNARYPEKQREKNIKNKLKGLAAKQYCQWR